MSSIKYVQNFGGASLPPGLSIASGVATLTDSSGAVQTFSLNGTETPTAWAFTATVAAGSGTVSFVATDTAGTAYPAVSTSYDTAGTQPAGAPTTQPTAGTVTVLTP
jgi:hypothetical protein